MNQDPRVIEFLPKSLSMEEVKKFIADQDRCFLENRYAFWAVEEKISRVMIGFCGFMAAKEPLPASAIEIGWRFAFNYWGRGYATEAARAVLDYGWRTLAFEEVFACTVIENDSSRRVMEKIGMQRDLKGDFEDPKHPRSKHVSYRIKKR
ncbi:MAG: GNAT family N-acetyltransferase [Chthoniobacterales bacterium]|nr:GNAT family N-acetyltransferase [Chthoniobacterales bacterium]